MKTTSVTMLTQILHWLEAVLSSQFRRTSKETSTRGLAIWELHAQEQLAKNRAIARIASHGR